MTTAQFAQALRDGKRVYGTSIISPSPLWPNFVKETGMDFVFLDTEHIPHDRGMLSLLCKLYRAMDILPIVRILSPDPFLASRAIDAGAAGIVAPYIETAEQVKALRGAVKLRPLKGEKMQRILDGEEMTAEMQEYTADYSDYLLIINIESIAAIDALDEILAVPQVDALLIGPHDLSCNMDLPEHYDDPRFTEAVRFITEKARAKKVGAGIHFGWGIEKEIEYGKMGMNFFIHSSDMWQFSESMTAYVKQMKQEFPE